jgi:translocation and assembly module TamA
MGSDCITLPIRFVRFLSILALFLCHSAFALTYQVEVIASSTFKTFLEENLSLNKWKESPRLTEPFLRAQVKRLPAEVSALMQARGYYRAQATAELKEEKDKNFRIVIQVDPGEPVHIKEIHLNFKGAVVHDDAMRTRAKRAFNLKRGDPFSHGDWENAKTRLLTALVIQKYPAAAIASSQAVIDKDNNTVSLDVTVDSGPVFYFGDLIIEGLQRYSKAVVYRYNPIQKGEIYDQNKVFQFQSNLLDSAHFDAVQVRVSTEVNLAQAAPVTVIVHEAKTKTVRLGVGASSNAGPRLSLQYQDRDVLPQHATLNFSIRGDAKEQSGEGKLLWRENMQLVNQGVGGLGLEDIAGIRQQKLTLGLQRIYSRGSLERTLSLNYLRSNFDIADLGSNTEQALYLNQSLKLRRVDDETFPHRGFFFQSQFGGGLEPLLTKTNFFRTHTQSAAYIPLSWRHTIIIRSEIGMTLTDSYMQLPPDLLFRTGGDETVRGYEYLSIGAPRNAAVLPGRYLLLGSIEYRLWVLKNWGVATFFDAGDAQNVFKDFEFKRGFGAGVRWRSPFGPVNVDLAYSPNRETFRVHFHFGAGF